MKSDGDKLGELWWKCNEMKLYSNMLIFMMRVKAINLRSCIHEANKNRDSEEEIFYCFSHKKKKNVKLKIYFCEISNAIFVAFMWLDIKLKRKKIQIYWFIMIIFISSVSFHEWLKYFWWTIYMKHETNDKQV